VGCAVGDGCYSGGTLSGDRGLHHEPDAGQVPFHDIRAYYSTMQYTGAIFAPIMGRFLDTYGFHTMFTFSAYAVTAVAVVTSLFISDARG